jgi:hypothetical protein
MTFDEFEKLMKLEKRELVIKIWELQNRVAELEKQNSDMGWRLNPDRMGGQFTEEERNRTGWL